MHRIELKYLILHEIYLYDNIFSLDIICENEGCGIVVKLDHLANHLTDCQYSQKKIIQCENGCGIIMSRDDLQVRFHRSYIK